MGFVLVNRACCFVSFFARGGNLEIVFFSLIVLEGIFVRLNLFLMGG